MYIKQSSKKYITNVAIITGIILSYFLLNENEQKFYGNDRESIHQVINSIEEYKNKTIEILEIEDIGNDRIVSFLFNNNPAYIQFYKNKKGDYEWTSTHRSVGESFTPFVINILEDDILRFMIVTNQENEVAKMQLGVNTYMIEQEISVNKNNVYWIDLPKSDDGSYTFTYKYFDENDNIIFSSIEKN